MAIVLPKIGELGGKSDGPSAQPLMVVPDQDLHMGQEFLDSSLEHAKPERLKSDVGVIEILHRRLKEQKLHL